MTQQLRDKLSKIYALIERGATPGEKTAARKALDRIVDRYNIDPDQLEDLRLQEASFTYCSFMEIQLLFRLIKKLIDNRAMDPTQRYGTKTIKFKMEYLDRITLECAYAYFRSHMKAQWIRTCAPLVKRCRTTKGKNQRRKELQHSFLVAYFIASNLVDDSEITMSKITSRAQAERAALVSGVKGGQYHKQTESGHYLNP